MTTTLISNVTVVDGTGGPRCTADVELADGRIARIADPGTLTASGTSIDGAGLVLSPGFIDMHAHPGRPDGAAVDADGCYWICGNDAGQIHRFTPDGRLDRSLSVPVRARSASGMPSARCGSRTR